MYTYSYAKVSSGVFPSTFSLSMRLSMVRRRVPNYLKRDACGPVITRVRYRQQPWLKRAVHTVPENRRPSNIIYFWTEPFHLFRTRPTTRFCSVTGNRTPKERTSRNRPEETSRGVDTEKCTPYPFLRFLPSTSPSKRRRQPF